MIWRAFVYDDKVADDRHKQAFNEFTPLDGKFRGNVVVQGLRDQPLAIFRLLRLDRVMVGSELQPPSPQTEKHPGR